MPVLGHPSFEGSYPSLANWSSSGPSRIKWSGQRWHTCQGDKLVSLVAYGPKVSDSALAMGVYSFWNQAGQFPTGRKGGRKRERERERYSCEWETLLCARNIDQLPSECTPTGDPTCNLDRCPDWGSNPQPLVVQDNAPTIWATQSGLRSQLP